MMRLLRYDLIAIVVFLEVVLSVTPSLAAKYYVPPAQFKAALAITGADKPKVTATFDEATGAFSYDEETQSISRVRVAVNAMSLKSGKAATTGLLQGLLGIFTYQEIAFKASDPVELKDGKGQVKGMLSMRGQSADVTMDAVIQKSEEKGQRTLSLQGSVKRDALGMADDGDDAQAKALGDTLTLTFDMQAMGM